MPVRQVQPAWSATDPKNNASWQDPLRSIPGKPLTQHDLIGWMLSQYEFSSRALKALAYQKLEAPIREALQVLEHAEHV